MGENRKSLLDEMAINLQNKSDEISRLANEVSSSKVAYEEQMKVMSIKLDVHHLKSHVAVNFLL